MSRTRWVRWAATLMAVSVAAFALVGCKPDSGVNYGPTEAPYTTHVTPKPPHTTGPPMASPTNPTRQA
jgi:hypothetical protein